MAIDPDDKYKAAALANRLRKCIDEGGGEDVCRSCCFADMPGGCLTNMHFSAADLLEKLAGLRK